MLNMAKKVPYRTKLRRTKVTKFFGGDENFVRRKILSDEHFVQKFFYVTVNDRLSAHCRDFRNNTKLPIDKKFLSGESDENF